MNKSSKALLFWCMSPFLSLFAQNKPDYQWILGGNSGGLGIHIDFKFSPIQLSNEYTGIKMEGSNTSISDDSGSLLFYSNGCKIVNAKGEVMENGDGINPGNIENYYCFPVSGSPMIQGVIALPSPEGDGLYYVLNLDLDQPYLLEPDFFGSAPQRLYYQKIDMTQDSGYGAVVLKNQIAVLDTFARGNIQAVQHTNGKDWWVVVPKSHSNCYFVVPVTADGVQAPQRKCLGRVWTDDDSGAQVVFSPDGKKYVRFNGWNGLNIFDFDAATGDLSNPLHIDFSQDTINYIAGVSISPNSRFLYVCARKNVYQYDLWANNIADSKFKVATWDGFQNPYSTLFYLAALGPDGKIYISNTSSTLNLHVIHRPNCYGLGCELEQHGIDLPGYNYATIPNFPHYRQSYLNCDSSLVDVVNTKGTVSLMHISPNPSAAETTLSLPIFTQGQWFLTDISGKMVQKGRWLGNSMQMKTQDYPRGLYFFQLLTEDGRVFVGKLVVQR